MRINLFEMNPKTVQDGVGLAKIGPGSLFNEMLEGLQEKYGEDQQPLLSEEGDSLVQTLVEDIKKLVSFLTGEMKKGSEETEPHILESLLEQEDTNVVNPMVLLQRLDEFMSLMAEWPINHEHSLSIQQLNQLAKQLKSIVDNPEPRKFTPFNNFLRTDPESNLFFTAVHSESELPELEYSTDKHRESAFGQFVRPGSLPPVNNQIRGEQRFSLGLFPGRQDYREQAVSKISLDRDSPVSMGLTEIHTKQYLSRLLDSGLQEQQGRLLVRKLVSIIRKAHFSNANQTKQMTIRLHPEHLGLLRVELYQKEGEMIARIIASTQMAKKLLDSNVHHLKQGLANQNLQIEKVDVTHHQNIDRHPYSDSRQGQNDQRGEQNNDQAQEENENKGQSLEHFSILLNDALFETEV